MAALKRICQIFDAERLPYVAVLHAPDEQNDRDNWHFHIMYYSRPAKLMTDDREEHFAPSLLHAASINGKDPDSKATKTKRQMELRREAWPVGEPLPAAFKGKWDFEVSHRYKAGTRSYRTAHPFRQKKSRRVVSKDWFEDLRSHVASSINAELESAGFKPKLHPGSLEDLDINKTPEKKLHKDQSDRELSGVPTITGLENERSDWEYRTGRISDKITAQQQRFTARCDCLAARIRKSKGVASPHIAAFDAELAEYKKHREYCLQSEFESRMADEYLDRLRSRPSLIIKRNLRIIAGADQEIAALGEASNKKLAAAQLRKTKAETAVKDAQDYLSEMWHAIGPDAMLPSQKVEDAATARARAVVSLRRLRKMLSSRDCLPEISLEDVAAIAEPDQWRLPIQLPQADRNTVPDITFKAPITTSEAGPGKGDLLARELLKGERRLGCNAHGHVVPITCRSDDELRLVGSADYLANQSKLQQVKDRQDASIANILNHLLASPETLQLRDAAAEPISKRYIMTVNVANWRRDFSLFSDDPQLTAAVNDAVRRTKQKQEDVSQRKAEEVDEKRRNDAAAHARSLQSRSDANRNSSKEMNTPVVKVPAGIVAPIVSDAPVSQSPTPTVASDLARPESPPNNVNTATASNGEAIQSHETRPGGRAINAKAQSSVAEPNKQASRLNLQHLTRPPELVTCRKKCDQ